MATTPPSSPNRGLFQQPANVTGVPRDSAVRYETQLKADKFLLLMHCDSLEVAWARGVQYRHAPEGTVLARNPAVYGGGGLVAPFIGIKLIDISVTGLNFVEDAQYAWRDNALASPCSFLTLIMTLLLGLAFPALLTGVAHVAVPDQAEGNLVRDGNRIIGSRLIGQNFSRPEYLHPRPSAAGSDGYDASASAATNLAAGSKDLRDAIAVRIDRERARGMIGASVPPDLVTTSASGLDPHLSPEAAFAQSSRIARAREISDVRVHALIQDSIEQPLLSIIGKRRIKVFLLNRQLDAL